LTNKTSIEVVNLLGELIYKSEIQNHGTKVELNNAAKSVYFVRVYDNLKIVGQEKIVITE